MDPMHLMGLLDPSPGTGSLRTLASICETCQFLPRGPL